jgi:deazaflavin-dependent oxidoreductase (nitroreductase family)
MADNWNTKIIDEFRNNAGRVGGMFEGAPMVILHTTGAKTGKERENPLMYLPDGKRILVFASKGGAPDNPDWYHNLLANPNVKVEVGTETYEGVAKPVSGEERDLLYAKQAKAYPQFGEYERKTTRKIPVVAIERAA